MLKLLIPWILCFGVTFGTQVLAKENPDELYRQGRFAEAEKAYARSDMDHPKDIRYRYNRGCAAYQNGDFQGAMAAFSSVLRRAKDDEIRFKALYNLGNIAYKQGDFQSAVDHYRQAVLLNPGSEDARYNLELALREREREKKDENEESKKPPDSDSDHPEHDNDGSKKGDEGESPDKPPQKKDPDQQSSQSEDQKNDKGQTESPKDLSGELKPLQDMPDEEREEKSPDQTGPMLDRKKAEALLDNLKEDRSRFLRFQIPEEKRRGVQSGKDW